MGYDAETEPGQRDGHEEPERGNNGEDVDLCGLRGHGRGLHAGSAMACERSWAKLEVWDGLGFHI